MYQKEKMYLKSNSNLHVFFISNTFIRNSRLKLVKNQAKLNNTLTLNFCYSKISCLFYPRSHPKIIGDILKNIQKTSTHVSLNKVTYLTPMKMKVKIKNRSHRYDINWRRPRHGPQYTKYKMYLNIIMVICIKQHLSNIWSSIKKKAYDKQKTYDEHWMQWLNSELSRECFMRKYVTN